MKLRQLFEQDIDLESVNIAARIARDCQPFLKQSGFDPSDGGTGIFRGQDRIPNLFRKFQSRTRKPVDSADDIHDALDRALNTLTGIKYRSHGVFATGDKREASSYGKACMFFPIGDFKFCWSPMIEDAYTVFDSGFNHHEPSSVTRGYIKASYANDREEYVNELEDFISSGRAGYRTDNLPVSRDKKHEIMFSCKEYYLLDYAGSRDPNHEPFKLVMQELEKLL